MTSVEWRAFDYEDEDTTAPPKELRGELVWIHEEYYDGVTFGFYEYDKWHTWTGSDDCSVSHWAPIEYPIPPTEIVSEDEGRS